ncbi:hypothetical protein [Massilia soli]|uniref:Uncharacterized protein n=1 Tax=Massilia soli TaxID=2792854 RepID=A0ABS7SR94_9BURK|nr:hypothetical protein [Massilia soli]MBZ2208477.1 hypothetical protein [Massilia soli]
MADPTFINGKWTVLKDPDDKRLYKYGFAKDLTDSNTTAATALAIPAGVTVLEPPIIQGTDVIVKLGGLDVAPNALNFCTIRLTCANGEEIDRTMWFVREDH